MRVVCNTRCLQAPLTGVQRYTNNILRLFPQQIDHIQPAEQWARGMTGHLWEQVLLPAKLKGRLLWSPSNSGPVNYENQVVTIHDVVCADHPEWFNKTYTRWYNYMQPRLCKKARHIITISEFTKGRLIDVYGVPASKITRVYNGCDDLAGIPAAPLSDAGLPWRKYVLALGSLEPRKNLPLLLAAWKKILSEVDPDTGLIIVGAKGNSKIFKDAGITEIPERVHLTGHLQDAQVAWLYRNALFFVYLSVYEGFGLPPLEAMSAGVPVITGDRTSLPEVTGEAGIKIDPYSQQECGDALLRLLNDEELRAKLGKLSVTQAEKFKWGEAAKQTWSVLERFS